ncbi:Di-sulfide bridge nucleocytoplasmic transport domain-containing protein [Phyllosticta citribraziliensis]|uniref:Di-sulfide bridge nucleocytoplasmic transport domain-containing protein n=1 Tax=Phyllosticta citribraziliensis TaxID=989973 RepID=A0ABR1LSD7_9PEZI
MPLNTNQHQVHTARQEQLQDSARRGLSSYAKADPELPWILAFYASIIISFLQLACFVATAFCLCRAVRDDIKLAEFQVAIDALAKKIKCSADYFEYGCDGPRMPAMENGCMIWELCMKKDVKMPQLSSARAMAIVISSFAGSISFKTLAMWVVAGGLNLVLLRYLDSPPFTAPRRQMAGSRCWKC